MAPKRGRNISEDAKFAEVVDQRVGGYKTVGQMVYAVLREAIISGAFAPGEWLRQESLAEAIGVSRIPVRTALLQLESEGMVTFQPHRGAKVRTLSAAQIDEIYRLRILLESHALLLSMARMTPERIARLRELAEQLDGEPEGGEFLDVRVQFYREVYDAPSNPLLVEMIEELRGYVGRYLLGFRFHAEQKRQHSTLVDRIETGDLLAAESWLRTHLEEVREGILALATSGDDVGGDDGSRSGEARIESAVADVQRKLAASSGKADAAASRRTATRRGKR